MYTGTLIEDLIAIVEQAQARAEEQAREEKLAYWYRVVLNEIGHYESKAGVA
jgi:hypothetical protein